MIKVGNSDIAEGKVFEGRLAACVLAPVLLCFVNDANLKYQPELDINNWYIAPTTCYIVASIYCVKYCE